MLSNQRFEIVSAISTALSLACTISGPWKRRHKDHFGVIKAYSIRKNCGSGLEFHVDFPDIQDDKQIFAAPLPAAALFVERVYTRENLALAYEGIIRHGLAEDVSDLSTERLAILCRLYAKDYFAVDYPFAR